MVSYDLFLHKLEILLILYCELSGILNYRNCLMLRRMRQFYFISVRISFNCLSNHFFCKLVFKTYISRHFIPELLRCNVISNSKESLITVYPILLEFISFFTYLLTMNNSSTIALVLQSSNYTSKLKNTNCILKDNKLKQ